MAIAAPLPSLGLISAEQYLEEVKGSPYAPIGSLAESKDMGTLVGLMREHGIPFHRPAAVAAHRRKMERDARRATNRRGARYLLTAIAIAVTATALTWLCWELQAVVAYYSPTDSFLEGVYAFLANGLSGVLWALSYVFCFGGLICSLGVAAWAVLYTVGTRSRWVDCAYESFPGDIPYAVKAVKDDVSRISSRLTFTISYFDVDPLMNIHFDDAELCVAAWDEPGLDAPLIT